MKLLPDYSDIVDAASVLNGKAIRTPLVSSVVLDEIVGGRVFFKAECLQRTGSFKFRGAYNALSQNLEKVRHTGVLACSSGNHAQGIAEASRLFGVDATIIMPSDAPQSKKDRTRRSGAEIVEFDRLNEDREVITNELSAAEGRTVIHPFNDFYVIAGQGTAGLEMAEQILEFGLQPNRALVCSGGGGLTAGVLLALKHHFPEIEIHSVEPDGYDDQRRSYAAGHRVGGNSIEPSVCDAILTPMPGELSFEICNPHISQGLVVTDDEALEAVAFAFKELKLVVEPGGVVTLAALLSGKIDVTGETVLATLSGGNIDPDMMARALKT